jgi:hypothetical protein
MKNTIAIVSVLLVLPFVASADSTVVATAGTGASVSPSGSVIVSTGDTQTFGVSALTGYHLSSVVFDGVDLGTPSSVDFTGIDADTVDHTLDAFAMANPEGALPYCSGPSAPGWNVSLPGGGCSDSKVMFYPAGSSQCPLLDRQGCMVSE